MAYSVCLDKGKTIGKVVYIVEGQRKELTLLSHIFTKVLDYTTVVVPRNQDAIIKYESKVNPNSKVFLVSAENSNISFISNETGAAYLDRVFVSLYHQYGLDITNAATYYVFDRDAKSNTKERYEELIGTSRDNETESNGLLLVSYPSIEAYQNTCIDDTRNEYISDPKTLKVKVSEGKYQYDKLQAMQIERACVNMLYTILDMTKKPLVESDLDDFVGC